MKRTPNTPHRRLAGLCLAMLLLLAAGQTARAQAYAVRTNAAAWAVMAPNVGLDLVLTDRTTLSGSFYKTIGHSYVKDADVTAVQLSYRHWYSHQPFNGLFWGLTVSPALYNLAIAGRDAEGAACDVRHRGEALPVSLDLGYSIPLSRRMNLEFVAGVGAVYFSERILRATGKERREDVGVAPTNLGVNLSWILK